MKLVCTKAMTYNTRRLMPGDEFDAASPRDAKLLVAIRKAELGESDKPTLKDNLRAEAEALGIEVDGRWKAKRIRAEIAKASE